MNATTRQELEALAAVLEVGAARIRATLAKEQPPAPPNPFYVGRDVFVAGEKILHCRAKILKIKGKRFLVNPVYTEWKNMWVDEKDCRPL